MRLAFAWTAEALLAGRKTVTRRVWKARTMEMWQKAWREGRLEHDAWDHVMGPAGRRIGRIRLTCAPYWERLTDMPEADLEAEGGLWADLESFRSLFKPPDRVVAVVRFVLVEAAAREEA